jgi:hypothetical protein
MAQTGTIDDLLNKDKFDNPTEENLAARQLREERMGRPPVESSSLDSLMGMASGIGGAGKERKTDDRLYGDNLGRPVMPESPMSPSRQDQAGSQSGIDSRLLAGRLKEEKNKERKKIKKVGEAGKEEKPEENEEREKSGVGGGLMNKMSRLRDGANLKNKAKEKIEKKITAPVRQGTNKLLCLAWENLIFSFGATLIYINIHVFLHLVLGDKLFCKLGEEWVPKELQTALGEVGKTGGKAINLLEIAGLLILDLIVLTVIGVFLTFIVMIVDFMQKGFFGKVGAIIGGLTKLGWTGAKALFDLF